MEPRALLIFNPNAGADAVSASELQDKIGELLPDTALDIFETSGEGDEEVLERRLWETKYSLILIAGGDGTVKFVAACAWEHCPMAILPLGSANGLARCLGINSLEDAWEALREMKIVRMDGILIDRHYCLHLADFGFNANLIHRFEDGDSRGMIAYVKSSLTEIFSTEVSRFELETDGEKTGFDAHMLVIANGDRYGTGAVINPEGEIGDGRFEVIAVLVQDAEDVIQLSKSLISGEKVEGKAFQSWILKSCRIRNLSQAKFQIDGELMGTPSEVTAEIQPGIFQFVTLREESSPEADSRGENIGS